MFLNDAYILSQIALRFRLLAFFLIKNLELRKAIQQRSAWMHVMQCMRAVHACSAARTCNSSAAYVACVLGECIRTPSKSYLRFAAQVVRMHSPEQGV